MRAFFLAWSRVSKKLPVDFQGCLPTVDEIEVEFARNDTFEPLTGQSK